MKNNFFLLCLLSLCGAITVNAQRGKQFSNTTFDHSVPQLEIPPPDPGTFSIDTLRPASFSQPCFINLQTSLALYAADYVLPHDSGFVTGNNVYGDMEKAQHYINSSPLSIIGCAVLLNSSSSSHTSTSGAKINLYSFVSNQPSTLLSSTPVIQEDLLNSGGYTTFNFPSPVNVSGDFLMSVVLPKHLGDSLAIYSTKTNCNSGSSLSWERAVDSTWGTIHTNWNFSAGNNIDLAIFPLIQTATGINEFQVTDSELTIYPNPSSGKFQISSLSERSPSDKSQVSSLDVYNVYGEKIVANFQIPSPDSYRDSNFQIDLGAAPSGVYFIRLTHDSQSISTGKLIITGR